MNNKTCKSCEHWGVVCDDVEYQVGDVQFRVCGAPQLHDASDATDCANIGPIFPMDGFSIHTGPDFGCVHHAARSAGAK